MWTFALMKASTNVWHIFSHCPLRKRILDVSFPGQENHVDIVLIARLVFWVRELCLFGIIILINLTVNCHLCHDPHDALFTISSVFDIIFMVTIDFPPPSTKFVIPKLIIFAIITILFFFLTTVIYIIIFMLLFINVTVSRHLEI